MGRACPGRVNAAGAPHAAGSASSLEVPDVTFQTIAVEVSAAPHRHRHVEPARARQRFRSGHARRARPAFAALAADEAARIVVLRGSGRHFCTGADLARAGGAARSAAPRRASRCGTCWRRSTPAEADHRGGARRRGRRRRGVRGLLRCRASRPKAPSSRSPRCGSACRRSASRRSWCARSAIAVPPLRALRRADRAAEALRIGLVHRSATPTRSTRRWRASPTHCCMARPARSRTLKSAAAQYASPTLAGHPGAPGAAQFQDAGGDRRDRELPRETQAELVSAMSDRRRSLPPSLSHALAPSSPLPPPATPPSRRFTRPRRKRARWSGTRA